MSAQMIGLVMMASIAVILAAVIVIGILWVLAMTREPESEYTSPVIDWVLLLLVAVAVTLAFIAGWRMGYIWGILV